MKKIELTQNQIAFVDDEDYKYLSTYCWQAAKQRDGNYYAVRRNYPKKNIYMHREIMRAKEGELLDHIDRNRLNNQKNNLRFCNYSQNGANRNKQKQYSSTPYKGVSFTKNSQKYLAAIKVNGKKVYLGYFNTAEEGAIAYDEAAKRIFREFSKSQIEGNTE